MCMEQMNEGRGWGLVDPHRGSCNRGLHTYRKVVNTDKQEGEEREQAGGGRQGQKEKSGVVSEGGTEL